MAECSNQYTISDYLKGKVRNISIPDETLLSICADADVSKDTLYSGATKKQKDLALAWLYVWIAGSPTQSGGHTEEDADWKSSENGERMSAKVLDNYLAMANRLFEKYGLETVSPHKWGFVGRGFRNIRKHP